jgi:hypothetical protein
MAPATKEEEEEQEEKEVEVVGGIMAPTCETK